MLIPSVPIASTRNVSESISNGAAVPFWCATTPATSGPGDPPRVLRDLDLRVGPGGVALLVEQGDQREDRRSGHARERAEREREEEHERQADRERERGRDDRLGERAPAEGLDGLAPVGEPAGERREQHVGQRRHDEQQRDHPGRARQGLHPQRERHDRELVAERRQADRCDQGPTVTRSVHPHPVHRGAGLPKTLSLSSRPSGDPRSGRPAVGPTPGSVRPGRRSRS